MLCLHWKIEFNYGLMLPISIRYCFLSILFKVINCILKNHIWQLDCNADTLNLILFFSSSLHRLYVYCIRLKEIFRHSVDRQKEQICWFFVILHRCLLDKDILCWLYVPVSIFISSCGQWRSSICENRIYIWYHTKLIYCALPERWIPWVIDRGRKFSRNFCSSCIRCCIMDIFFRYCFGIKMKLCMHR